MYSVSLTLGSAWAAASPGTAIVTLTLTLARGELEACSQKVGSGLFPPRGELASQLPLLRPGLLIPHHKVPRTFRLVQPGRKKVLVSDPGAGFFNYFFKYYYYYFLMLNSYSLNFVRFESRGEGVGPPTLPLQYHDFWATLS